VKVIWCDYVYEQDFWTKLPFWWFSPPFEPHIRIINSAWCNLIIEKDCYDIALKPIRLPSYSKPCQLVISRESFQGWLPVAHFIDLEPEWRYRDSLVAIDLCQWCLIGHYLFEAYLGPHPLDSACASHALLAIQEYLGCGANSPWFSRTQLLSLWANRDCF
jgi:hypothetical protein